MYDMMNAVHSVRMPVGATPAQTSFRNVRERTTAVVTDSISLASAARRAAIRRAGGNPRICGVYTTGERRCAYR